MLTDSYNILNNIKNYFCQLLDTQGAVLWSYDVRELSVHIAEPCVPTYSPSETKISIEIYKDIHHHVLIKFRQDF
jgi:hypothetical protein